MKKLIAALLFWSLLLLVSAHADEKFPEILDAYALKDGSDGKAAANPCENFYEFACGGWIEKTVLPPSRSAFFRQSSPMSDQTDVVLNRLLVAYAKGDYTVKAGAAKKLGDYYSACVNSDSNRDVSLKTLQELLAIVDSAKSSASLARAVADLHLRGIGAFFSFGSSADPSDSSQTIASVQKGGMSLPNKDYYLNTDKKSVETRAKYLKFLAEVFTIHGDSSAVAAANAKAVFAIEKKMALKALSLDDQWDPSKTTHPMALTGLKKLSPEFSWSNYFSRSGLKSVGKMNVTEPEYIKNMSTILKSTSASKIRTYLRWHVLNYAAGFIGGEAEKADFAFWNTYLRGQKEPLPKWKSCTQEVANYMTNALAEAYVSQIDSASIITHVKEMILQIKDAFREDLERLATGEGAWLDVKTKDAAIEKLNLLDQKLGAPDKWVDYSPVNTTPQSYLANSVELYIFENKRDFAKIGKPTDRTEWGMGPWEVNAYYNPEGNEFVFPFGILMPPSLDLKASDGANLGSFGGGTIGHELTHGWDDDGRKYDGHGNIKDWWSEETKAKFAERSRCFVEQANAYTFHVGGEDVHMNGEASVTENLADQGGVKLGYAALDKLLSTRAPAPIWNGRYDERQQFWIGYAQSWCSKRTVQSLRNQIMTDVHPPEEFRVNGVLMNRTEFARDFGCKAGDKMAPATRCSIW